MLIGTSRERNATTGTNRAPEPGGPNDARGFISPRVRCGLGIRPVSNAESGRTAAVKIILDFLRMNRLYCELTLRLFGPAATVLFSERVGHEIYLHARILRSQFETRSANQPEGL